MNAVRRDVSEHMGSGGAVMEAQPNERTTHDCA